MPASWNSLVLWLRVSKCNGELLALAAAEFDAFLTADRNISYQQDISAFDICGNRPGREGQRHRRPSHARSEDSGSTNQRGRGRVTLVAG